MKINNKVIWFESVTGVASAGFQGEGYQKGSVIGLVSVNWETDGFILKWYHEYEIIYNFTCKEMGGTAFNWLQTKVRYAFLDVCA